jgi:hypothetical protein
VLKAISPIMEAFGIENTGKLKEIINNEKI